MSARFIRIYKELDFNEIKAHLLIYGALSGSCAHCKTLDLKLDTRQCPQCGNSFKYVSFINIKDHIPKMLKLNRERSDLVFVDYDDFKRIEGVIKAEEFLK